jgi:hypothetical protein
LRVTIPFPWDQDIPTVATISEERTMGLLKVITISVNAIIIVSAPTATISVIIARTVGTIMIRSQR